MGTMARPASVVAVVVAVVAVVAGQECDDPAVALTSQLLSLAGQKAVDACNVCAGEVRGEVSVLRGVVEGLEQEVAKGRAGLEEQLTQVQEDAMKEQSHTRDMLAAAEDDRLALRVLLDEVKADVTGQVDAAVAGLSGSVEEASHNATQDAAHLQQQITELTNRLDDLEKYIKGARTTSRASPSVCQDKKVLMAGSGYLASSDGSEYSNNTDCTWVIERPAGQRVKLTWLNFALQRCADCKCDYVEIWDGPDANELVGGQRWCGYRDPPSMVSTSNVVEIRFHTDDSHTYNGFTLKYESIEE